MDGWEGSAVPPTPPANNAQEPDRSPVSQNSFSAGNAGAADGNNNNNSSGSSGGGRLSGVEGNDAPAAPPTAAAAAPALASLPAAATHSYLGEATTGSSLSREDLEVGSTVDMPILSLPGVVLFPGESLPLRLHNPAYALLAESLLGSAAGAAASGRGRGRDGDGEGGERQAARHLGVVNRLDSRSGGLLVRTSPVGTTAEIRSGYGGSAGDDGGGGGGFAVMARGRHRFRLVEDLGWRRGVRYWKVTICPDLCPGPLRPPIPRAFRDFPGPARGGRSHWAVATPRFVVEKNSPAGLAARAVSLLREQREPLPHGPLPQPPDDAAAAGAGVAREEGAAMEVPPDDRGASRARAESPSPSPPPPPRGGGGLRRGGGGSGVDAADDALRRQRQAGGGDGESGGGEDEQEEEEEEEEEEDGVTRRRGRLDPTLFSFWLAANLPLHDDARQQLLLLDSVVMRLRMEVKHLEKSRRRALCCAGCGIGVAWEGDVFTLPGAEGVVGAYVNPLGYVHQTVTVRNARNLMLVGAPTEEHTWFPGYAWTAAYCERCPHQLGWRFTAVNRASGGGQQPGQQQPHRPVVRSSEPPPASPSSSPSSSSSSSSSLLSAGRGGAAGMGGGAVGAANDSDLGPSFFFGLCRSSLVGEVRNP